jgi:hypothetical protein
VACGVPEVGFCSACGTGPLGVQARKETWWMQGWIVAKSALTQCGEFGCGS